MTNKKVNIITYVIVFGILIFVYCGATKGRELLFLILQNMLLILKSFNLICVEFNGGDGILNILFCHPITYFLVGTLFCFMPSRRNVNKLIGEIAYWLLSFAIGAALNWLSTILFVF